MLDVGWRTLQRDLGIKAKRPRPRFCFVEEPVFIIVAGQSGFIFGYYNPKRNEVLLALTGNVACSAVHELLHALYGLGHQEPEWSEHMSKAGCS